MKKDYFLLALSNLRHRGLRSWLTMLGIFIGIAAVVSLISLGNGLQQAITGQFAGLSTDRLLVQNAETSFGPPGSTAIAKLTEHDIKIIESVSNVKETIPRIIRVGKVEYNKITSFTFVGSLPEEQEKIDFIYTAFNINAEQGKLLKAGESGKVILGHDFIKESNGFEKPIRVGSKVKIQGKEFEVSGILEELSSFQFNSVIFMPEQDVKEIFNIGDEIDLIVVGVDNPKQIEETAKEIERKLRNDRNEKIGEEDFSVQTPSELLGTINTILVAINVVISGIAAISLLVGGIGIANTMFTSVLERTKEIGTMKAVGARNSDILLIFLIESGMLGLVGGIIGAIIGIILAFGVSAIANQALGSTILEVSISWPLILASIAFSFIIGVSSGIIPAFQASKLKPVEALRR